VVSFESQVEIGSETNQCVGGLLGTYATTNGANRTVQTYLSRWRYTPVAQEVNYGEFIYST
jgi:hypothetical protein